MTRETATLPVFINYDKAEDAIAYEDRFVTQDHLIALSKHPRKATSSDADHIFKRTPEDQKNRILLFIRKNKDDKEAKEFYFLGRCMQKGSLIRSTWIRRGIRVSNQLPPVGSSQGRAAQQYITKDA